MLKGFSCGKVDGRSGRLSQGNNFRHRLSSGERMDSTPATNQSTSIPLLRRSVRAISISFINSSCASGTSLKVKTPHPSLNRRYAPNETIAQRGSCLKTRSACSGEVRVNFRQRLSKQGRLQRTYNRNNLLLDCCAERDQLEKAGQVELYYLARIRLCLHPHNQQDGKKVATEETRRARDIDCCACVIVG